MGDFYDILGVSREATPEEIRSAFRRLARLYHPDVSSLPNTAARFAEIATAYRVLSDPELRAQHDRGATVAPTTPRESRRRRAARAHAYKVRVESVINDILEAERREVAFRSEAVLFVVGGWFATFAAAVAHPSALLGINDVTTRSVLWLACLGSVWWLAHRLQVLLAHYTYRPSWLSIPEATLPPQPFSRTVVLALLLISYGTALAVGYSVGILLTPPTGTPFSAFDALHDALLFTPLVVALLSAVNHCEQVMRRST